MASSAKPVSRATVIGRLASLAMLRSEFKELKDELNRKKAAFDVENARTLGAIRETMNAIDQEEAGVRAMGLTIFEETGEAKPAPGIEIKQKVVLDYDDAAALAWAKKKGLAVQYLLDKKAFEAVAKASPADITTEDGRAIVVVRTEPVIMIATDIDKALKAAQVVALDPAQPEEYKGPTSTGVILEEVDPGPAAVAATMAKAQEGSTVTLDDAIAADQGRA